MEPDDLLSKAIASYAAGEPGAEFADGVTARMQRRRGWLWTVVPALAAALVVFWLGSHRKIAPAPVEYRVSPVEVSVLHAEPTVGRIRPRLQRVRQRQRQPNRINRQEGELLRWVARSPDSTVAEWLAFRNGLNEPLAVKRLEIEPISIQEINE